MRINPGTISEILARADIAEVIGAYVSLRKRGNDLVGLCPFHAEKTPSFHVHPDRRFFKCFGCGVAGDVIAFYGRIENLNFPQAAAALARRVGVTLEPETPAALRVRSEKEAIIAANESAASFFARSLSGAEGTTARAYCSERGISPETIASFKLGYAPERWDALVGELVRERIDLQLAAKAGLVRQGERGYYDFYRGRLMIPTFSTTGEVVAFGGRSLDGTEPKYINTSTTPVYTKGRGLFALERARRHVGERGALIIVEGYLDCIALHQAGFPNTVASLGTSFTPEQAAELRKYTERVFICFDADTAGSAATSKSIDILQAVGCSARIVHLPPGEDPDSFIRTHPPQEFQSLLDSAIIWVQDKVDREIDRIRTGFVREVDAAQRAERFLQTLPALDADRWRVYMAGRLGVSVDALRASRLLADPGHLAPRIGSRVTSRDVRLPAVEREIMRILLEEPSLVAQYAESLPLRRFRNEGLRTLYERMLAHADHLKGTADVLALFAEEPACTALLLELLRADPSKSVRFAGSEARREQLDRVLESFIETDDLQRRKELDQRMDAGLPVSEPERDEYRRLVEKLEGARRRRLSTRSGSDRKEKEVSSKPHGT